MEWFAYLLAVVAIHVLRPPSCAAINSRRSNKAISCGGESYLILADKHTWLNAPAACHKEGLLVATVRESNTEAACVQSAAHFAKGELLWVAAYRSSLKDKPRDAAGRALQSKVLPSNLVGCAAIGPREFVGRKCTEEHHVLCRQGACLADHVQSGGSCYYMLSKKNTLNLQTATSVCRGTSSSNHLVFDPFKGQLLQLETHMEAIAFYNLDLLEKQRAWLGAHRWVATGTKRFHWLTGNMPVATDFWADGEPSSSYDCMSTASGEKSVASQKCSTKLRVICELELCKSGWTFSLDYCLKLFETPETHSVASRLCHSEDLPGSEKAHLLSVESEAKFEAVRNIFLKNARSNVWLGLNLTGARNEYRWTESGRRLDDEDYTDWAPHEPNGQKNGERCVELGTRHNNGYGKWRWNDVSCNQKRSFICQQNTLLAASKTGLHSNTSCPSPPEAPANSYRVAGLPGTQIYRCEGGFTFDGNVKEIKLTCGHGRWNRSALEQLKDSTCRIMCRDGWVQHGSHCYSAHVGKKMSNFTQAARTCKQHGGYLVEILDSMEATFVAHLAKHENLSWFYIGLSDRLRENDFIWEHSRLDVRVEGFDQWPNGVYPRATDDVWHQEDDCVMSSGTLWNTGECQDEHPFICERDLEVMSCSEDRSISTSHTYKRMSYSQASEVCLQRYSHLPVLTASASIDKCLATAKALPKNATSAHRNQWLALRKQDGGYFWRSSQTSFPLDASKAMWAVGQPVPSAGDCVLSDSAGRWHTTDCNNKLYFQCEHESLEPQCPPIPPTPLFAGRTLTYAKNADYVTMVTYTCWKEFQFAGVYGLSGNKNRTSLTLQCVNGAWNGSVPKECTDENCAPGYHYFDSTCYKLHDIPKTKPAASAACINEGAELVTVMSQVQENYLAHMIGSTAKGRNGAWIKLNDERMENEYRWGMSPNSPLLTKTSFIDWGLYQPDNSDHGENCVELRGGGWNDVPCGVTRRFLCFYDSNTIFCPDPDYPLHGKRTGSLPFFDSDTVEFSCSPGYVLTPKMSQRLTCRRNKHNLVWDKPAPTCIEKTDNCNPSQHGCSPNASCFLSQHHGAVCKCRLGFTGDGTHCTVKSCPPLVAPANGSWSTTATKVSTVAKLTCQAGYAPAASGGAEATCLFGGFWNSPSVHCVKVQTCGGSDVICSGNEVCVDVNGKAQCACVTGYQVDDDGQVSCKVPTCPALPAQANGVVGMPVLGEVKVSCNKGYELYSPRNGSHNQSTVLTCQVVNGRAMWNRILPPCVDFDECSDMTMCGDRHCINIPGSYVCVDKTLYNPDCILEAEVLGLKFRNGYTRIHSQEKPPKVQFFCNNGFQLSDINAASAGCSDLQNNLVRPFCADVNECMGKENPCSKGCRNTPGSYQCECTEEEFKATMPNGDSPRPMSCYVDLNPSGAKHLGFNEHDSKDSILYTVLILVPLVSIVIVAFVIWRAKRMVARMSMTARMSHLDDDDETCSVDGVLSDCDEPPPRQLHDDDADVALLLQLH